MAFMCRGGFEYDFNTRDLMNCSLSDIRCNSKRKTDKNILRAINR